MFVRHISSRQCIPAHIYPLLKAAKDSVDSLQLSTDPVATRALKDAVAKQLNSHNTAKWNAQLDGFKSSPSSRTLLLWNLIVLFGIVLYLPSRQMSFVLCAGSDTLPTQLNLARWKIQSNPRCPICGSRNPTSVNILNGCVSALNQGRDTWRHDSVLSCIVSWLTRQVYVCWLAWSPSFWPPPLQLTFPQTFYQLPAALTYFSVLAPLSKFLN